MSNILQDLRFALRQLRGSPAFAITAILALALGIGANTAIFSLLDQALLRSLPVRDPQELVVLKATGKAWDGSTHFHGGDQEAYFSYPMYKDLRDHNQALDGLAATLPADIGVSHKGVAQLGRAELVSGNYFSMLGVQPALGRVFTQSDDLQPDANPVAVLSFDFWKNQLGADPAVVGSTLSINGHPFQVIGVASPRFQSAVWGETPSLFVPITMLDQIIPGAGKRLTLHTDRGLNLIGRLKPGESRERAEVALAPLWHALRAEELKALGHKSSKFTAEFLTNSRLSLLPGATGFSYQRDDFKQPLLVIMGMALLVLLIASVNVASLLLVRSAGRARGVLAAVCSRCWSAANCRATAAGRFGAWSFGWHRRHTDRSSRHPCPSSINSRVIARTSPSLHPSTRAYCSSTSPSPSSSARCSALRPSCGCGVPI